jgi:predicted MFS family arabinose efflux permease
MRGIGGQAVLGFVAQITQQVTSIGMVLVVAGATGSLARAGLAAAFYSIGAGMARPVQGRLIDRRGPRAVLVVTGCLHAAALACLAREGGAPIAILLALAWLAGTGLPPVSVAMRIEWARRRPPELRTATYSLVYLVQELALFGGPLLFGGIVAVLSPSAALTVIAVVAGAGALVLAWAMRAGRPEGATPGGLGVLRDGGMRLLLTVIVLLGGALGVLEVGLPALAVARGVPAVSGLLVAAISLGGIAGALGYGRLRWAARPARRLVVLLTALCVVLLPLVMPGDLYVVGGALFLAGLAINPALATSSLVVDELAVAPAEAFGWLSTAIGAGSAAGGGLAGAIGQYAGAARSLLPATLFAALGAAVSLYLAGSHPQPVDISAR